MICKHLQVPVLMSGSKQDHGPRSSPRVWMLTGAGMQGLCRAREEHTGAGTDLPKAWGEDNCNKRASTALQTSGSLYLWDLLMSGTRESSSGRRGGRRWGHELTLCLTDSISAWTPQSLGLSLSCGLELCKNQDLWLKDKASYTPAESLCSSPSRLWRNPNPPGMHSRVDPATPSDASHTQF